MSRPPLRRAARWIRHRIRRAAPLALALLIGSTLPALAQFATANGQLAVRSDGFIFWIQDGQRHVVYPVALSDDQINALPEGAPLNASLQPGTGPVAGVAAPVPTGSSRADRLVLGQTCLCSLIRGTGQQSDLQIRISGVERDAWSVLRKTNPSNQLPRDGFEYVLITVNVKYTSGPRDLPVSVERTDFTMLDSNNVLYTPAFAIEPQPLTNQATYPGMEVTGSIAFQVPKDDPDPVLVWHYNDDRPTWFAIR